MKIMSELPYAMPDAFIKPLSILSRHFVSTPSLPISTILIWTGAIFLKNSLKMQKQNLRKRFNLLRVLPRATFIWP